MIFDGSILVETPVLGALVALKPMSYMIRIGTALLAFSVAMNADKVIARVIGFVWLLVGRGQAFFCEIQLDDGRILALE